jgi:hypothetical protein
LSRIPGICQPQASARKSREAEKPRSRGRGGRKKPLSFFRGRRTFP